MGTRSTFRPGGLGYEPFRGRRHPWLLAAVLIGVGLTVALVAEGPAKTIGGVLLVFGVIGSLVVALERTVSSQTSRRDV